MRPQPKIEPPRVEDVRGQKPAGMARQVRRYELITPLFGGGVEPQKADPITTVRGSEIRGHLRFWWRACRGGRFDGSLEKMKAAEDALWGAAASKDKPLESKVFIALSEIEKGEIIYPFKEVEPGKVRHDKQSEVPAYAAFPLQPDQDERQSPKVKLHGVQRNVKFTLTIDFPEQPDIVADVEAALWAWETFGGIGGRTRRGFGALRRVEGPGEALPDCQAARAPLVELLHKHSPPGKWPNGVPHLDPNLRMKFVVAIDTKIAEDVNDAWEYLLEKLRKFRQARDENGYGPSKWPEPDSIRRYFTARRGYTVNHPVVKKFPRAALGLPIVFKFRSKDESSGDPQRTILQGTAPHSRMASPLILKPLACANGYVSFAAILQGTNLPPGGVKLKSAAKEFTVVTELDNSATPPDKDQIPPLLGTPDVLDAFLKHFVKGTMQ